MRLGARDPFVSGGYHLSPHGFGSTHRASGGRVRGVELVRRVSEREHGNQPTQ